ncbi:bifunctional diguanylate cyclase/phosphodiesterase [Variovorax sp. RT4R15]|uniref:bifunctional diguanylate cyclase/phosphodiesterase n=1 Tax=Variovorax sp. RT4R15 TaxID=3443737 RepID=UPI003F46CA6D
MTEFNEFGAAALLPAAKRARVCDGAGTQIASVFALLGATNEAVLRASTVEELFRRVCSAVLEDGKFQVVAVCTPDPVTGRLEIVAVAGAFATDIDGGLFASVDASSPDAQSLAVQAYRSGVTITSNDFPTERRIAPRDPQCEETGVASVAALPLRSEGRVAGVLALYCERLGEFDPQTLVLVERMAQNIGFGLEKLERDSRRRRAEDLLRDSEQRVRSVLEGMEDGYYEVDLRGRYLYVNEAFVRLLGYSAQELEGLGNRAHQSPEMTKEVAKTFKEVYRTGEQQKARHWEYVHKDGRVVRVEGSVNLLREPGGECIGFFGMLRDITARTRTELALRVSEEKYRTIVQSMGDSYFEVDLRGRLTLVNPAFGAMLGRPVEDLVGRCYRELHTESAAVQVSEVFRSVFATRRTVTGFDWEMLHRDGRVVMGEGLVQPVFDEHDRVSGFRGTLRDVTERRRNEQALRRSEQRFRALAHLSTDWFWELDTDLRYRSLAGRGGVVPAARDNYVGRFAWETALTVQAPRTWAMVRAQMEAREAFRDVVMFRTLNNGRLYFLSVSGEPVFSEGVFEGYRGISREITKEKRAENRIQFLATHDALTGLPNRLMFSQLLTGAIRDAQRVGASFAVLFIDLDRFKFVNDTLGHDAGDTLLQEITGRFRDALGPAHVLARLGGDEFVALLQDDQGQAGVAAVAARLLAAALQPLVLHGQECRVSASIGAAQYPAHGDDERTLMKNADAAMYFAKDTGKNNLQFYSEGICARSLERLAIESRLRTALERNELSLHYQAQIDLATYAIVGVEALLRWNHPDLGSVSPLRFIGIAEETGLIVPIGKWALREACRQSMAWQRAGLPSICMAVNLSARQFQDERFLPNLAAVLRQTGLPPHLLELEITEGMVAQNPETAAQLLHAIKAMGVRLAIDDFGTGYSSLAQLKAFPIDTLKIDRSFIHEVVTSPQDKAITQAIIAMGKSLSLTVVAEGVETFEQEQFLRQQKCDRTQGYFFSRPVSPEAFANLLESHEWRRQQLSLRAD